ncbi:prephenate dehydrogenase/arogenate dehydrogenase family protein [Candidatus Bathyarchaeota archaeon]|nr:prephenate dehydrogenase/arogenate dehydrogenase family protein [Candidatus Bathyarchaeota archaeon]MBS7629363.1 prephenate dehydrogenase/arogenate dehydrogenase family protein [Candidatus Bathyarchaeota archaeon]
MSAPSGIESRLTVNIVGGAGKMGKLLAKSMRGRVGTLRVISRSPERAEKAARELDVEWAPIEDAHNADVVIVSVPMDETVNACKNLAGRMSLGSLLVDLTSVKTGIVDAISASTPPNIEYLSVHPLFGPNVENIAGKRIIAIKARPGPKTEDFIHLLESCGCIVKISTVKEHDEAMASIQVLHHFALLSLSKAMIRLVAGRNLSEYLTESFERTLTNIESIERNLETIYKIQRMNPYGERARKIFIEEAAGLNSLNLNIDDLDICLQNLIKALKS